MKSGGNFSCINPDEMNSKPLAEKTRYFKKDEKGVKRMCKIMEDFAREEKEELKIQIATELLEDGAYPIPRIAEISKLSENKVKELAESLQAIAR